MKIGLLRAKGVMSLQSGNAVVADDVIRTRRLVLDVVESATPCISQNHPAKCSANCQL